MNQLAKLNHLSDLMLSHRAAELGWQALDALAKIDDPAEAINLTHDIKAIKDRIAKMKLDFDAMFPWAVAWLDGMRRTGQLISAGQEAGSIQIQADGGQPSNKLLLGDLGLNKMQSSRWQRLGQIDGEDFRTWYEELQNIQEQRHHPVERNSRQR